MALSKRLAVLLGGDVVLSRSQPEVGSTFTVTIAEEVKVDETNLPVPFTPLPKHNGVGRLAGMRLLVVDDVADNRILISKYLESEGASVVTATGGQEAIALGLQDGFHAILMDLSMPEMSGQEATSELRGKGYKIPILALTAHAMREEKEKALKHGFNDYLTKPVVRDVLVEALRKIHEAAMHFD
ncbi:MAG: response regulator [Proteobacteria bacterium]|nr:response regulator [Pseudomonadota bacterium]